MTPHQSASLTTLVLAPTTNDTDTASDDHDVIDDDIGDLTPPPKPPTSDSEDLDLAATG